MGGLRVRTLHQLYELVTGKTFVPADQGDIPGRIQANVEQFLSSMKHA